MRRWLVVSCTLFLAAPVMAAGFHQPPSDAGEMPLGFVYSKTGPDANVRTPVIVTGGAGPGAQRIAYGSTDGVLHLQVLERGVPVRAGEGDPELGIDVDDGPVNDTATFGQGTGAVAPVDTSLEDRLGHLLVLHNDNGAVHLAQVDLLTGEILGPQAVQQSLGCTANSTPVLTPPDGAGDRFIFFTMTGGACRRAGLLRAKITKAATREGRRQPEELTPVADLVPSASPALVYLEDPSGAVRPMIVVAAANRLLAYPATGAFDGVAPAFSVPLPAGETPQSPVTPITGSGLPAGAPGSGAAKTPSLYVAASSATGETRVHQFVQRGSQNSLTLVRSSPALAGAPAPTMGVGETAEGAATRPGGRLVVTTSAAAHVLETGGLGVVGSLPANPGFSRTSATLSGSYAYLMRDNGEPVVLRTADGSRVGKEEFAPDAGQIAGDAFGAPGVSRGFVVWGGAPGAFAYRNRDVTAPVVELESPTEDSVLAGAVTFTAMAGDSRGIKQVDFRLVAGTAAPRVVARDTEADDGSPFLGGGAHYSGTVQAATLANGVYVADAVVTDAGGNTTISGRRTVRVAGSGKETARRRGRCANPLLGAEFGDQLTGTPAGDRIHGGAGDDVLRGLGGRDCLAGAAGDDRLEGGPGRDTVRGGAGDDRLAGGSGNDRLRGGSGENRVDGGAGNDYVDALNGRRDRISCGRGRDRGRADRIDVLRSCEKVRRMSRPRKRGPAAP